MCIRELEECSQKKPDQCSNIIIENINNLNNDCLIQIFEFLPIEDKLKIEMVCTRWKKLSKIFWTKVNNLYINKFDHSFIDNCFNIDEIVNFYKNVLIRCGPYLNNLLIINDSILGIEVLKKEILKYCNNIKRLCLIDNCKDSKFLDDNDLNLLFSNNTNLRSLSLERVTINGNCLENLPFVQIEELELINCEIASEEYFYKLLCNVRNLKILNLMSNRIDSLRIFNSLNESNCTSVCQFSLLSTLGNTVNFNKEFFVKQKNLSKISLQNVIITEEIVESFSKNSLEEISYVKCNNSILMNSLNKFTKLNTISLDVKTLNQKYFKLITEAITVKYIKFTRDICVLSSNKNYFLKKLQIINNDSVYIFDFNFASNIDKLLDIMKSCKYLETLNIGDCNYTGLGVTYINKFINLKNLNISLNQNVTDDWLIFIVKKLPKLEKLFIFYCTQVTNKLVKEAIKVKTKRKDTYKLEIFCFKTKINVNINDIENSLILLNYKSENLSK